MSYGSGQPVGYGAVSGQPVDASTPYYGGGFDAGAKYGGMGAAPPGTMAGSAAAGSAYGMSGSGGGFVTGVPLYPDHPTLGQRFVVRGPRDVWAAVVFAIQLLATIIVAFANISWIQKHEQAVNSNSGGSVLPFTLKKLVEYIVLAVFMALVLVSIALAVMCKWPRQYIYAANIAVIVINVAVAIVFFIYNIIWSGVLFLLAAALNALWLYCVRRRIPLAAELLGTASSVVSRHWGCIATSFGACVVTFVYYVFFVMMAVPSYTQVYDSETANNSSYIGSYLLGLVFLLMMYWSLQVIFNVVHVTASGTVATWYFAGPENMPPNPAVASLKRAMTTSFGSICFGSLVVAILKLMHHMARSARHGNNGFAALVASCLLGCIERLIEYFNVYAYAHVAIYGSSFIEAAKQTWELIKNCVWSAVINDNLVYPVLNLTIFFNGAAVGVICGFGAQNWVIGVLSFFIAAGIHLAVLRVVYSGVVTMFVCVAECPDALLVSNPVLRQHLDAAITEANRGC